MNGGKKREKIAAETGLCALQRVVHMERTLLTVQSIAEIME